MKKLGLSSGTTADLIDWVSESICGPTSPTYGKFCAVSQEMGEDSGIVVGKSIMKTYAIADVSGIVSGNNGWHVPYALWSDLSTLSVQVQDISTGYLKLENDAPVFLDVSEGLRIQGNLWNDVGLRTAELSDFNYIGLSSLNRTIGLGDVLSALSAGGGEQGNYVPLSSNEPIRISAIENGGFAVVLGVSDTPYFQTAPLMTTQITKLSAGDMELADNGNINRYIPPQEDYALSSWNWLRTQNHGMGDVLSGLQQSIMGDVSEDFVSFVWLNSQNFAKEAQLSAYLPLSGGKMSGSISWDYAELGGPYIEGAMSPVSIGFGTTYADLSGNHAYLDLSRIPDQLGTIAFVEEIEGKYLPLSGGTMDNGATVTFYDEQDNKVLELDGQNGRIIGNSGVLENFVGFSFEGGLKYALTDTDWQHFTPQTPTANSSTIMRGGDIYAVLGDISALIHAT